MWGLSLDGYGTVASCCGSDQNTGLFAIFAIFWEGTLRVDVKSRSRVDGVEGRFRVSQSQVYVPIV